MNNKLLKSIEYLFYLMILLYLVGKSFEVLTILIDIIFIVFLFKNKVVALEYYKRYKEVIWAFGILLLYFLVQSFFTNNIVVSLKHSVGMLRFIILLFALIYVFNTKEKIKNVMIVSFVALFIVNVDSLYQYFNGVDLFGVEMYGNGRRLNAWNEMPVVSLYSGEFFGILLSSVFLLKGNLRKIAIFSCLFFIIIFLLSGNRSPIIALFSTILIIGIISEYRKKILILFVLLVILFFATFSIDKLSKGYKDIITPKTNSSINGRKQIYETSWEIIKSNPIIGIGAGMFRYDFKSYYQKNYNKESTDKTEHFYYDNSPYHSHNILLDILVSYGLIGLILFLNVLYNIYKKFIKNNSIALVSSIGFLYCITPLQFAKSLSQSNWQFYTFLGLIFMVLISIYNSIEQKEKNELQ